MPRTISFNRSFIAPCGMNCGSCIGYLRPKNSCSGCWSDSGNKPHHCHSCKIINCEKLKLTSSKFCYDCPAFPCRRLEQLDKRYRTNYNVSFIENLLTIKERGINNFIAGEDKRWTCPECGSTLSCHRNNCIVCNLEVNSMSDRKINN